MIDHDQAKILQTKWQVRFPYGDTYYFFTEFGARQWLSNAAQEGMQTSSAIVERIPEHPKT